MAAVQELLDCMISRWYAVFQRVTFKTVLLPLPQPVLDWLVADGLHLPEDSQAVSLAKPQRILKRSRRREDAGAVALAAAARRQLVFGQARCSPGLNKTPALHSCP